MAFNYKVVILDPSTQEPQAHIDVEARSVTNGTVIALQTTNVFGVVSFSLTEDASFHARTSLMPPLYQVVIPGGEGSGPFCDDYLIDENWATIVAADPARSEGDEFPTFHGHTFKVYSTIDGAMAHAEALAANSSRSFLICPGTYAEAVNRGPPSGADWYIRGIRDRTIWQATANSDKIFNKKNNTNGDVHIDGITFDQSTFSSGISITNALNWIGSIKNCHFIGGNSDDTSFGIVIFNSEGLDISNCIFSGRGTGIAETGLTTAVSKMNIRGCHFIDGLNVGLRMAVWSKVRVTNCYFDCATRDITLRSALNWISITNCHFEKGIYANSLTSYHQLIIADSTFNLESGEVGIDLGIVTTVSDGLNINNNSMLGAGTAIGIDLTDAQNVTGVVSDNTFEGFTSGEEIKSAGIGADVDIFHNISDAGAMADVGDPVGHAASGTPVDDLKWTTATELTISSGAIAVTQSAHTIDTESDDPTDDLDTINGLTADQLYFFYPANDARTVVFKHGTGNIECIGNQDITLDDDHDFVWAFSPDGTNIYVGLSETGKASHARIDAHMDTMNGSFIEPFTFAVTSDGATITGTLDKNPTGDLTERFSDGYSTATSGATVTLTAGSDTSPQKNFVYILQSNKGVLVASTSDWPTAEHNKIAEVILQSAGTVQTEGVLVNRFWNDFTKDPAGQGHHLHSWERMRFTHSAYKDGVAITWTITTNVGTPDNVDLAVTAGRVYQLHLQDVEAKDTGAADNVHVVNDSVTPYDPISDFADLLTDSAGGSMSGRYFNLVVWGSVSSGSEPEHLFVNLPSGSYNKQGDAIADVSGFTNFTIPADFRGQAFLISRITLRHQAASGGTWTSIQETDLRGQIPNIVAGGGTAAITTEFADNAFKLFDDGDPTKLLSFQLSGITTGNTRVLTVPDGDGTLLLAEGLAGGQTLVGDTAAGGNLILQGTAHATPGDIIITDGQGLVVGHTSAITFDVEPTLQVLGTAEVDSALVLGQWSAAATAPSLQFFKSRQAAIGAAPGTIVSDNDVIGALRWYPDDGVDYATLSAEFFARVDDNSPAAGDIGTEFVWNVMPGGGGAIVERMVLSRLGGLQLPQTSTDGGITLGGDTQIFRSAANTLRLDSKVANAYMALDGTTQTFGSAIVELEFLSAAAVNLINLFGTNIVQFADATNTDGLPTTGIVQFATGVLNVFEDIDISGHIALGASADINGLDGAVLVLAETGVATDDNAVGASATGNINQLDIALTYTPAAISGSTFRGLFMEVQAGGDEDMDGAFLAGATSLQFITQHNSDGDINTIIGAAGQTIVGNNPLAAESSKTPHLGGVFPGGTGLQGTFIWSSHLGYDGGTDALAGGSQIGVSAIRGALLLRTMQDALDSGGGDNTLTLPDASILNLNLNMNDSATANRLTVTNLALIDLTISGISGTATITTPISFKIAEWPSGPTYTNGPYAIVQEGNDDTNWLAGHTYIGRLNRPTAALADDAKLTVDQQSATGAIPVLILDQADVSEGTINFIASARATGSTAASDIQDTVRVELNGTVYRLALYTDA